MLADLPLLLLYTLLLSASASPFPSRETLGIAPQDESYYAGNVIRCRDGSRKFSREQLNDEFCDCPDGTDEPGTSACPEGRFYCRNTGHSPLMIFSSRVNDGICDCCDGSDEYDGRANCTNTCWEAGKIARDKLKKKIETYQEGVIIRKQEIEIAKAAFARDEAELSKLKNEENILKDLVQKLQGRKEQIEKVEEQERLQREKEEQEQKLRESESNETEQRRQAQSEEPTEGDIKESNVEGQKSSNEDLEEGSNAEVECETAVGDDSVHVSDHMEKHPAVEENGGSSMLNKEAIQHDQAASENAVAEEQESGSEGLSKEELGRLVASRWTGEQADDKHDATDSVTKEEEHKDEYPDVADGEDDDDGYNSENEEDIHKYSDDDDDFHDSNDHHEYEDNSHPAGDYDSESDDTTDSPDFTTSNGYSWLDKIQQTVQHVLHAFNFFKPPVNTSEAAYVRKEYDGASSKLSKIQSRISSLTEKLKQDYGKEKEFYSFYNACFEYKENKYIYKVCPFKQASQVEGHSTTRLGQMEKFDENYRLMQFLNGDKCWNGPDRSLKVRLRCGLKNELADVDEPSRCEYSAILSTPLLCLEERLKELEGKLQSMNSGQPSLHDEL